MIERCSATYVRALWQALPTKVKAKAPPLVLLPLSLASSQWDPLLSRLSTRYRTVTLGGPELGFLAMLESRGRSAGYLSVVRRMMDVVQLRPGEVRPGGRLRVRSAGSLARPAHVAEPTASLASTSIDIFSARPQLSPCRRVSQTSSRFRKETPEALPFPDNHVDVALSFTVLEEGNADRMLAELVRVAKPGGRVAVMVRALDIPWVVNVPLRPRGENQSANPAWVRWRTGLCRCQSVPAFSSGRADTCTDVATVCRL